MEQVKGNSRFLGRWINRWSTRKNEPTGLDPAPLNDGSFQSPTALGQTNALDENLVLTRALARAQQRSTSLLAGYAARVQQLDAEVMQLRAAVIVRDSPLQLALGERLRRGWTPPQ